MKHEKKFAFLMMGLPKRNWETFFFTPIVLALVTLFILPQTLHAMMGGENDLSLEVKPNSLLDQEEKVLSPSLSLPLSSSPSPILNSSASPFYRWKDEQTGTGHEFI